jgi:hypothetical protein
METKTLYITTVHTHTPQHMKGDPNNRRIKKKNIENIRTSLKLVTFKMNGCSDDSATPIAGNIV